LWRMLSSGMWRCVALVRTDIWEERITSIRVKRISVLGTMLAVTSNWSMLQRNTTANVVPSQLIAFTLMMEVTYSSETWVLTRATWSNIPEDGILHSHCRDNLKFYTCSLCFFFNIREWVLCIIRATGKIIVSYIIIFVFRQQMGRQKFLDSVVARGTQIQPLNFLMNKLLI
jgi:hypothetical protein